MKKLKEENEDKHFFLIRFGVRWSVDKVKLYPSPDDPNIRGCVKEGQGAQNLGHRG